MIQMIKLAELNVDNLIGDFIGLPFERLRETRSLNRNILVPQKRQDKKPIDRNAHGIP